MATASTGIYADKTNSVSDKPLAGATPPKKGCPLRPLPVRQATGPQRLWAALVVRRGERTHMTYQLKDSKVSPL